MLSIILCSHAGLAEGLKSAAEMICGTLQNVESIAFHEEDSPEAIAGRVREIYDRFAEQGNKVVAMADLLGATPFNCCAQALAGTDSMIVAGMSLPVLLEMVINREQMEDYREFVTGCVDAAAGTLSAVDMSEF